MSLEATIWAKENLPRARTASAKVILLVLADEVRSRAKGGDGRTCWPGRDRIGEITGLDRRTVGRALDELEQLALVKRYPRFRDNGRGRKSDRIELFGPAFCWRLEGHSDPTKGARLPDQGGRDADQGGDLPPEPSKEPPDEYELGSRANGSRSSRGAKSPSGPKRLNALEAARRS